MVLISFRLSALSPVQIFTLGFLHSCTKLGHSPRRVLSFALRFILLRRIRGKQGKPGGRYRALPAKTLLEYAACGPAR